MTSIFEPVLADLGERQRDEILAAFAAVEHSPEPVPEAVAPGLRDATLRRSVAEMLHLIGRTLVRAGPGRWTSGYRDDVAAQLTADGGNPLPLADRAVLTLVLIHSVAIPRTEGMLSGDSWVDGTPTPIEELQRRTQLPRGELRQSLGRLRAAGLVRVVPARLRPGTVPQNTAYLPGPQFHRLTEAARRRLQEELILAAGPDTPLAAAIRRRRADKVASEADKGGPLGNAGEARVRGLGGLAPEVASEADKGGPLGDAGEARVRGLGGLAPEDNTERITQ